MASGIELFDSAFRIWRRAPALAGLATAAIGLATALLLALTSIFWGVFEAELPGVSGQELYVVQLSAPSADIVRMPTSPAEYLAWQDGPETPFASMGAFVGTSTTLTGHNRIASRLNGAYVTPSLMALSGAQPLLGRVFGDEADDLTTVLLGYDVWIQHFGADPDIRGRQLELDGQHRTVVGVMPPGFRFPLNQDLWYPLQVSPETQWLQSRLQLVARLHPDTSLEALGASLSAQVQRLRPQDDHAWVVQIEPYLQTYTDPTLRRYVLLMAWAAFGVLLVAALNVSCLLAGRTASRLPELATRRLLGARGIHLMGSSLGEAAGLAAMGGGLGFALAWPLIGWLDGVLQAQLVSYWIQLRLDVRSVGLTFLAVLFCVLLSAALPMWMSWRHRGGGVASGKRPLTGFLRAALVLQIAMTAGLLVPTGALIQSLGALATHQPALATDDVMRAQIALPWSGYRDVADRQRFYEQFLGRLAADPSWTGVTLATSLPGDTAWQAPVEAQGVELQTPLRVGVFTVTDGLLETFDVELLAGRPFDSRDAADSEAVAWISARLAADLFGSPARAVDRLVRVKPDDPQSTWMRVVGVVPDPLVDADMPISETGHLQAVDHTQDVTTAAIFRPLRQAPGLWLSLAAESTLPLEQVTDTLRRHLHAVDPSVPLFWQESYGHMLRDRTWDYRLFGQLFIALGLATLGMTAIGLLGVAVLLMRERRQELAVRQVVGASPAQILSRVLRYAFVTALCGLALGHLLGGSTDRVLQALFFQLEGLSLWHHLAVDGVFLLLALLAFGMPAREVANGEPAEVLKEGGSLKIF